MFYNSGALDTGYAGCYSFLSDEFPCCLLDDDCFPADESCADSYTPTTQGLRRRDKHRDKLIERKDFLNRPFNTGHVYSSWEDYLAHIPEWPGCDKFWKRYYLSGCRKMAKQKTNRKIRNDFKKNLSRLIDEDHECHIGLERGGEYRKVVDYDWFIW